MELDLRKLPKLITKLEFEQLTLPEILTSEKLELQDFYTVGISGPPGAGKSTLLNKLISYPRKENNLVGVVSIDPSSPFTGGALLGDRIRMLEYLSDKGVFMRSMATRKALGGLAPTTREVLKLMGAFGFGMDFIETVGVGQSEIDVINIADTVVVVMVAGVGDGIQTLKAGLLEIADIMVVNMADKPEAQKTVAELRAMQSISHTKSGWKVPILETVATSGKGVDKLWEAIKKHKKYQESSDVLKQKRVSRFSAEVLEIVGRTVNKEALGMLNSLPEKEDPYKAADLILQSIRSKNTPDGNI